jgi:hypothetical protein
VSNAVSALSSANPTKPASAPPDLQAGTLKPREFFIQGVTSAGRPFRPSDWAERLCGVMSCYRPGGIATGRDAYIGYSPYVRPTIVGGVKCVVVDERLKDVEKLAFEFVMSFASDNDLPVVEACSLPPTAAAHSDAGGAGGAAARPPDITPSP